MSGFRTYFFPLRLSVPVIYTTDTDPRRTIWIPFEDRTLEPLYECRQMGVPFEDRELEPFDEEC